MATLIYFLDGADAPELTGNAYAEAADIDLAMKSFPCVNLWENLLPADQIDAIVAITAQLDAMVPRGHQVDVDQPLIFPRDGLLDPSDDFDNRNTEHYGIKTLKKHLIQAVAIQIEANIFKGSISQLSIGQGKTSVVDKHFQIHPFARQQLKRWIH